MDIILVKLQNAIKARLLREKANLLENADFENFTNNSDYIQLDVEIEHLDSDYEYINKETNVYKLLDFCENRGWNISLNFLYAHKHPQFTSETY